MEFVTLDEVCEINMGQSPSSDSYNEAGDGLPFFQGNADFGELYPTTRFWCNAPTKVVAPNTLLISVRAPIGALNFSREESCIGRGLAGLTVKKGVHAKYLYYALMAKTEELQSRGTGTTFQAISKNVLLETRIKKAPFAAQELIAQTLDKLQSILARKQEQLRELDLLVKSQFIEMFGDLNVSLKYPVVELGSISGMLSGGTPSSKHPEYFGGNMPFVSTPSLGPNYIDASAAQNWLTESGIANSSTHRVPAYSLMFGNRVGVGKSSINTCEMCTNQDILSFVNIDTSRFDLLFLKKVLDQYEAFFDSQKRGATIKGIPSDLVKASKVPLVPIDVQRKFVGFVQQSDKSKLAIQQSSHETERLFHKLMQDYFHP